MKTRRDVPRSIWHLRIQQKADPALISGVSSRNVRRFSKRGQSFACRICIACQSGQLRPPAVLLLRVEQLSCCVLSEDLLSADPIQAEKLMNSIFSRAGLRLEKPISRPLKPRLLFVFVLLRQIVGDGLCANRGRRKGAVGLRRTDIRGRPATVGQLPRRDELSVDISREI